MGTETDRNRLQLIPKRTSMGTRKGRVGYDRNDPNKVMNVLVGMYVGRNEFEFQPVSEAKVSKYLGRIGRRKATGLE